MSADEQILFSIKSVIERAKITHNEEMLISGLSALNTAKTEIARRARNRDAISEDRDRMRPH